MEGKNPELKIAWDAGGAEYPSGPNGNEIPRLNLTIYGRIWDSNYNIHLKVSPMVLGGYNFHKPETCIFEGYLIPDKRTAPITVLGCPFSDSLEVCKSNYQGSA